MIEFLKLHWICIERADGVSPLVCFGDDGGGGGGAAGGGGGEGGTESTEGGGQETFEGGANFDSSPSSDAAAVEAGNAAGVDSADFDGTGLEGGTGGSSVEGGGGSAAGGAAGAGGAATGDGAGNFESLGGSPPSGYADYGSAAAALGGNVAQGTGAPSPDQQASQQAGLSPDINAPSPNAPSVATPAGPSLNDLFEIMSKEKDKEDEEDKDKPAPTPAPPPPPEQWELPSNAVPTSFNSPYAAMSGLNVNTFVGPSQKEQGQMPQGAPPPSTVGLTPEQVAQSNQWDIGPTTAVNAFGVGPTANPFASTNVWDVPAPPTAQAAPQKEEQNPWDQQQTAFNTFGFNPTTPTGYNMPSAISGTPTGAPPPDQQVAAGQPNAVQTTGFIAPNPTTPVTQGPPLGPAVPTGKADQLATGRDPFSNKDPWNPDYFAPQVGMMMANIPSMAPSPPWEQTGAQAFGPQAPPQASPQAVAQGPQAPQGQAPTPTYDQVFNTTPIAQQSPNLFDLPVGTKGPPVAGREERERDRPENREPVVVGRAPDPSVVINTGARSGPPWSDVPAPTVNAQPPVEVATPTPREETVREPILDPNANIVSSLAPMSKQGDVPTGQQGNPLAGGVPGGSVVELPGQGGGAGPIISAGLAAVQGEMDRRKKRSLTDEEKRNAITEALMRRDLFAPGVSDFDRLRLQP